MYQMCAGPTAADPGPVWHVLSKNGTDTTLCGAQVPAVAEETITERHCLFCLDVLRDLMRPQAA
ncbi:hypothetical protein BX286_3563 [Streptomyces sp. 3211.6]|uniref:hypothetical protein n=1 Tax=Streptomyces sp. 3211.6 TaxID=1938845 RepID=UPI000F0FAEBB|nr:hypothetical protein [Streptomyces sp. 3211.6]RKT05563.1 hypothetical protein BX286_3563 [Streptomyces sp. 3211.6]